MKLILKQSEIRTPPYNLYCSSKSDIIQDFNIYEKNIEMDVRMISTNGFRIPDNCDVEVEMKFTFVPKTPKTETITLK